MATSITSSASAGGVVTYVITDQQNNALTVVANPTGGSNANSVSYNMTTGTYLLPDGQELLSNLNLMLQTGLRPNVIAGTNSFSN